ncbi:hypothetical protein LUZ63_018883 [Rhynchospora breviuscula]|uniref:Protein FAR1-RELATED SEQUENCE n=1 Tax=Rhynchospora breviuscula TaxID=2022672 RepID=A0A9Q0HIX6_9POAL|nr:hypothetical protein LUZ63_018883 [Rhynchospora breviuscula]
MQNGDAEAMMSFFRQAKRDDPEFYYACKFSPENRLEIVFWADSVSRAAYRYFGDAVSFDATYIVNKYDLPVAPIVGINHHYQTIVLGCSMMTTEDGDSYEWILQSFLDYEKIGLKVNAKKDIRSVVWDSTTEDQFESRWQSTITQYSLQDNAWLTEMFDLRAKWVPAYLSKIFWAGMSSNQRSESMNAFLDMFVNSKTCLSAFVKSFDSGLARLKRNELNEDYNCIRGDPKTFTEDPIEHQFSALYTHKMFYKLQAELLGTIRLTYICSERLGVRRVYEVEEYGMRYSVKFNTENQSYICDCHLFEADGIICRHGLLIFRVEKVQVAPDMYILNRWCKDRVYKRHHLDAKAIAVKINERRQAYDSTYMLLHSTFLELIDYALLDEPTLKAVADGLNALRSSIANSREMMIEGVGNSGSNEGSHTDSNVTGLNGNENQAVVQDPVCKRRWGRNPAKRMQGVAEKIHKKIVKKKKLEEAEAKIGTDARCSRVKTSKYIQS